MDHDKNKKDYINTIVYYIDDIMRVKTTCKDAIEDIGAEYQKGHSGAALMKKVSEYVFNSTMREVASICDIMKNNEFFSKKEIKDIQKTLIEIMEGKHPTEVLS